MKFYEFYLGYPDIKDLMERLSEADKTQKAYYFLNQQFIQLIWLLKKYDFQAFSYCAKSVCMCVSTFFFLN